MAASSSDCRLNVKVHLGDDIRRISLESRCFYALTQILRKSYGEALPARFQVKYKDPDDELITMTSASELEEACALHATSANACKGPLRLWIIPVTAPGAKAISANELPPAPACTSTERKDSSAAAASATADNSSSATAASRTVSADKPASAAAASAPAAASAASAGSSAAQGDAAAKGQMLTALCNLLMDARVAPVLPLCVSVGLDALMNGEKSQSVLDSSLAASEVLHSHPSLKILAPHFDHAVAQIEFYRQFLTPDILAVLRTMIPHMLNSANLSQILPQLCSYIRQQAAAEGIKVDFAMPPPSQPAAGAMPFGPGGMFGGADFSQWQPWLPPFLRDPRLGGGSASAPNWQNWQDFTNMWGGYMKGQPQFSQFSQFMPMAQPPSPAPSAPGGAAAAPAPGPSAANGLESKAIPSSISAIQAPSSQPVASKEVHSGVTCDGCHVQPIVGIRYHCSVCSSCDLCEACESRNVHNPAHPLVKLRCVAAAAVPVSQPLLPFGRVNSADRRRGGGNPDRRRMQHNWRQPTPEIEACKAKVVGDGTLPDRSLVLPSQTVIKTWLMQNTGSSDWPEGTKLCFLRGDRCLLNDNEEEFPVRPAKVGQTVEVNAPLTTPPNKGRFVAYFRLADGQRNMFGPRLWADVVVVDEIPSTEAGVTAAQDAAKTGECQSCEDDVMDASALPCALKLADAAAAAASSAAAAPAPAQPAIPAVAAAAPTASSSCNAPTKASCAPENAPLRPQSMQQLHQIAKWANQLTQLATMGFSNTELNCWLLNKHNGDVDAVAAWLLEKMK